MKKGTIIAILSTAAVATAILILYARSAQFAALIRGTTVAEEAAGIPLGVAGP